MKKLLLPVLFVIFTLPVHSQNIDNASFDSIYIGGIDRVFDWITSDVWPNFVSQDTIDPLNPSDHYIGTGLQFHETFHTVQIDYGPAFHGPYAIRLFSFPGQVKITGEPFYGFVVNGNHFYTDTAGYLDAAKGGTPFAFRPSALRGHFKYTDGSPGQNAKPKARILLKKFNSQTQQSDTIGFAESSNQFYPDTNWTLFQLPVTYYSSLVPDSIIIMLSAADSGYASLFYVDSLGFEYNGPAGLDEQATPAVNPVLFNHLNQTFQLIGKNTIQAIRLFNISGQLVYSCTDCPQVISYGKYPLGMYLLQVQFEDGMFQTKFLR